MTQATTRKPNLSYEFWTKEEISKVGELRAAGYTYAFIAEKMGRSIYAVKSQTSRLCLPKHKPTWTAKEDKIITDGWKHGDNVETLMKKTGRSYSSIASRLHRLGIFRPSGFKRKHKAIRR